MKDVIIYLKRIEVNMETLHNDMTELRKRIDHLEQLLIDDGK